MIKKEYMKPIVEVVKIQHQTQILAGSVQGYPGEYDPNGDDPDNAG
jgi:hypothetical protein